MNELLLSHIKRIQRARDEDKLVIFVGAGVSANSGVPMWYDLIESLKRELPNQIVAKENDYLKIAQYYKNYRGQKEYIDKIRSKLKFGKTSPNPLHDLIVRQNPSHIITTNYDDLLEKASMNSHKQFYTICCDDDLPHATYNKFIIKMHGDLQKGNIVLTEDDYLHYHRDFPIIETYVKSLLSTKLILFIGFSFDDLNLKIITDRVKDLLKDNFQPMYLLSTSEEVSPILTDYYKERGVRIVDFDPAINNYELQTHEVKTIDSISSEIGKKLYRFCSVVFQHDYNREKYSKSHIIETFYEFINYYFDEVRQVGTEELMMFPPFHETKSYVTDFTLNTDVHEICKLNEDLKKGYKEKKDFLRLYGTKYRQVVKFAIENGIFFIRLPSSKENKIPLGIIKQRKPTGLDLFYDLNFLELLDHIEKKKSEFNENTEVTISSLELPYLLFKCRDYYQSYVLFKQLAQKCWVSKKYILYFICLNNIKNIAQSTAIDKPENYARILSEVEIIDIDIILNKILIKNQTLYKVLRKVQDYSIVYSKAFSIENLINKIHKTKELIERGGFSSNQYLIDLNFSVWQLFSFTNNNCIASEHYSNHQAIYKKAFEGFLLSHTTKDSQSRFFGQNKRLNQFEKFHLKLALNHISYEELRSIFSDHQIYKLGQSIYTTPFLKTILFNAINAFSILNKVSNTFSSTIRNSFQNILLILAKTEIKLNDGNEIIEAITRKEKIVSIKNQDAISIFINNPQANFSDQVLLELLKKCFNTSSDQYIFLPKTIKAVGLKLSHETNIINSEDRLSNYLLNPKFLRNYSTTSDYIDLLAFFKNKLSEEQIDIISANIQNFLEDEFKEEVFRFSYKLDLVNSQILIEKYISYFMGLSQEILKPWEMSTLCRIYFKSRKNPEIRQKIKNIAEKQEFMQFIISPDTYENTSAFDINWIKYIDNNQVNGIRKNKIIKEHAKELLKGSVKYDKGILEHFFRVFG